MDSENYMMTQGLDDQALYDIHLCLLQDDCAFCNISSRNRICDCAFQRNQTRSTWSADDSTGWMKKEKSSCMFKRINNRERTADSQERQRQTYANLCKVPVHDGHIEKIRPTFKGSRAI